MQRHNTCSCTNTHAYSGTVHIDVCLCVPGDAVRTGAWTCAPGLGTHRAQTNVSSSTTNSTHESTGTGGTCTRMPLPINSLSERTKQTSPGCSSPTHPGTWCGTTSKRGQSGKAHICAPTRVHVQRHVASRRGILANCTWEALHYCLPNVVQPVKQMHTCVHIHERAVGANRHACKLRNDETYTDPQWIPGLAHRPQVVGSRHRPEPVVTQITLHSYQGAYPRP